jgi:hypothetical protein
MGMGSQELAENISKGKRPALFHCDASLIIVGKTIIIKRAKKTHLRLHSLG